MKMKKFPVVIVLLVAASAALAGPSYINEMRTVLTHEQVVRDTRYAAFARQFGLRDDVFDRLPHEQAPLPVGSSGKFRCGTNTEGAMAWPPVTPEESATMPGVLYDLGDGWFLHAQLCTPGNAMLFYGRFPPRDGAPGRNGTNGRDGANGTNGVDGANGTNGKDGTNGQSAVIDQVLIQQQLLEQLFQQLNQTFAGIHVEFLPSQSAVQTASANSNLIGRDLVLNVTGDNNTFTISGNEVNSNASASGQSLAQTILSWICQCVNQSNTILAQQIAQQFAAQFASVDQRLCDHEERIRRLEARPEPTVPACPIVQAAPQPSCSSNSSSTGAPVNVTVNNNIALPPPSGGSCPHQPCEPATIVYRKVVVAGMRSGHAFETPAQPAQSVMYQQARTPGLIDYAIPVGTAWLGRSEGSVFNLSATAKGGDGGDVCVPITVDNKIRQTTDVNTPVTTVVDQHQALSGSQAQ